MLQWFQRLMPRQDVFFPAFERHAALIVAASAIERRRGNGHGPLIKVRVLDVLSGAGPE